MRWMGLSLLPLVVTLSGCTQSSSDEGVPTIPSLLCETQSKIRMDMLSLVNKARAEGRSCGGVAYTPVAALTWNSALENAAMRHVDDLAYWGIGLTHTGTDGSSVGERVSDEGYVWAAVGENLQGGATSSTEAVAALLASPAHCANIMSPTFTQMGGACAGNSVSAVGTYWAQVFAAPTPP